MNTFLRDYIFIDQLGQGGFASVYKVRHKDLDYIRAIRVLRDDVINKDDKRYQNFIKECKILLRLGNGSHPNITHIYRPRLIENRAIVEMDYIDGSDLFHYIDEKNGFIEIDDVINLLSSISSALSYCHYDIYKYCMDRQIDNLKDDPEDGKKVLLDEATINRLVKKYKVIHNDIHSGNIMRREDGRYVLLDFGLSIDGEDVVRSSKREGGVPEFKAPEKWDVADDLSTQSDIYSFGIVLYSFLAGRVPFVFNKAIPETEAKFNLMNAHKKDIPEPIFNLRKIAFEATHPGETYVKDYPDWLEKIILKCLEKDPKKRYKDGKELYDDCISHLPWNPSKKDSIDDIIVNPEPPKSVMARLWKNNLDYKAYYSDDNNFIYFNNN